MKYTIVPIILVAILTACSDKKVTPDRLEEARQTAKDNATMNAQLYRAANPRFTGDYSIVSRSDDGQKPDCPQGDGWASVSIMKVDGKIVDKTALMCSTYSTSAGCYREEDFNKLENLARQNSGCNKDVPFPLPTLKNDRNVCWQGRCGGRHGTSFASRGILGVALPQVGSKI